MQSSVPYRSLPLDSIANSATFFLGKWTPHLMRNRSPYLLSHLLSLMYFPSQGNLFHARIRASHEALAASVDLKSREWVCKCIKMLRAAGWIETFAPRLPNGKQEITIFRPGKMLKRLLVMLLKSPQRSKNRVNTSSQKIPSKEQIEKNKTFLADLIQQVGK